MLVVLLDESDYAVDSNCLLTLLVTPQSVCFGYAALCYERTTSTSILFACLEPNRNAFCISIQAERALATDIANQFVIS